MRRYKMGYEVKYLGALEKYLYAWVRGSSLGVTKAMWSKLIFPQMLYSSHFYTTSDQLFQVSDGVEISHGRSNQCFKSRNFIKKKRGGDNTLIESSTL